MITIYLVRFVLLKLEILNSKASPFLPKVYLAFDYYCICSQTWPLFWACPRYYPVKLWSTFYFVGQVIIFPFSKLFYFSFELIKFHFATVVSTRDKLFRLLPIYDIYCMLCIFFMALQFFFYNFFPTMWCYHNDFFF